MAEFLGLVYKNDVLVSVSLIEKVETYHEQQSLVD